MVSLSSKINEFILDHEWIDVLKTWHAFKKWT